MKNILKSFLTWIIWLLSGLIVSILGLLISFMSGKKRYTNKFYFKIISVWQNLLLKSTFISITVNGKNNLPKYPNNPAIFIANHLSALDIPVLESLVGSYPHIWISKVSYGKIPIFGWLLNRMNVLIDKNSTEQSFKAFIKLYKISKDKDLHILLFPEGQRSEDGKLLPLKEGFLILSKKLNRPIIPIVIKGLDKVLPKKSCIINSNVPVDVYIGEPVLFDNDKTLEEQRNFVSDWYEKHLE
ncbi:1-acyl-sn-glycerol-3-phosphate acyltransferase [Candidatus Babeliales bacterium]|nr:1-acyl-sn-glycerol-3-phosphate acyltransferase [Candidatus Babeliales bacterium]